jgi:hypothetical protein
MKKLVLVLATVALLSPAMLSADQAAELPAPQAQETTFCATTATLEAAAMSLPTCRSLLGTACSVQYVECSTNWGTDWLVCWQGSWAWA